MGPGVVWQDQEWQDGMCKSWVRAVSQAIRKEIGRFKSWFNIPQALSASEDEDIRTAIFYSNLFWGTQCLYFYLLSVRQSLVVKLLVTQEFEEYCTSPQEASCNIGKVQATFYVIPCTLKSPWRWESEVCKFWVTNGSIFMRLNLAQALWPALWLVSAFNGGIWTSQSKGTCSVWTRSTWMSQLHLWKIQTPRETYPAVSSGRVVSLEDGVRSRDRG